MTTLKRFNGTDWEYVGLPNNVGIAPLTIGYAETLTDTGAMADLAVVPNLRVTVTVPEGRRIRVSCHAQVHTSAAAGWIAYARMDGVAVGRFGTYMTDAAEYSTVSGFAVVTPSAGTHVFDVQVDLFTGSGTTDWNANTGFPMSLLVEDITGSTLPYQPASVPVGVLGRAEYAAGAPFAISAGQYLPGLSVNVTVPAGRLLKISMFSCQAATSAGQNETQIHRDGISLNRNYFGSLAAGQIVTHSWSVFDSPSAGTHIYSAYSTMVSAGTQYADGTNESWISVEDITPTPSPATGGPSSTLAYAESTVAQSSISSEVDVTGCAATITVPAGRRLRISGRVNSGAASDNEVAVYVLIKEGANELGRIATQHAMTGSEVTHVGSTIITPTAGTHTYKLTIQTAGGTVATSSLTTSPNFILVEDITGQTLPVGQAGLPSSTLGYAQAVADQGSITTQTALTGLTTTLTVPAGRRLRITGEAYFQNTAVNAVAGVRAFIQEDGVQKQQSDIRLTAANIPEKMVWSVIISPAAGTHTYRLTADNGSGGVVTMVAGAAYPSYILVEDITGVGIPGHTHSEINDSGWIALAPYLANGWVSYDNNYGPPRFRKLNGVVYVQGLVRSGTLGSTIATLPAGYRPSLPVVLFPGNEHNGGTAGRLDMYADGRIVHAGGTYNDYVGLASLIFPADQ